MEETGPSPQCRYRIVLVAGDPSMGPWEMLISVLQRCDPPEKKKKKSPQPAEGLRARHETRSGASCHQSGGLRCTCHQFLSCRRTRRECGWRPMFPSRALSFFLRLLLAPCALGHWAVPRRPGFVACRFRNSLKPLVPVRGVATSKSFPLISVPGPGFLAQCCRSASPPRQGESPHLESFENGVPATNLTSSSARTKRRLRRPRRDCWRACAIFQFARWCFRSCRV